jgi:hypothetical protein
MVDAAEHAAEQRADHETDAERGADHAEGSSRALPAASRRRCRHSAVVKLAAVMPR